MEALIILALVSFLIYYLVRVHPRQRIAKGSFEKQCPDCKTMIHKAARVCPYCRKRFGLAWLEIFAMVFFILFAAIAVVKYEGGQNRSVQTPKGNFKDGTDSAVIVGDEGRLYSGAKLVPVAVSGEAFEAWTKARVANDTYGQEVLLGTGLILTPKMGTRVLVIDRDFLIRKVRILEGEYQGQAGWVSSDYIRK